MTDLEGTASSGSQDGEKRKGRKDRKHPFSSQPCEATARRELPASQDEGPPSETKLHHTTVLDLSALEGEK